MLFQIYGETAGFQLLGWLMVFVGLILANEFARRTKWGGCLLPGSARRSDYLLYLHLCRRCYGCPVGAE